MTNDVTKGVKSAFAMVISLAYVNDMSEGVSRYMNKLIYDGKL